MHSKFHRVTRQCAHHLALQHQPDRRGVVLGDYAGELHILARRAGTCVDAS
ncbi:hypothetical protein M8542_39515 [Amycolatopsis sp. OK19-0408]|uniref:Uncharacterized protein n=1 Tax=Amycolatopsis iheyensis TaxID=2945988 RepID=A0A9X2SQP6_9PSEU|nr:hypothetical protein [Amycolatopsis iheyensis]MCR6488935.1 hypothetical protein [Amycolatopsis iheyensis]